MQLSFLNHRDYAYFNIGTNSHIFSIRITGAADIGYNSYQNFDIRTATILWYDCRLEKKYIIKSIKDIINFLKMTLENRTTYLKL